MRITIDNGNLQLGRLDETTKKKYIKCFVWGENEAIFSISPMRK